MKTDNRLGHFDEVVANATPEVHQMVEFLRNLIIEIDFDTVEVPRPGERSVAYGIGPRKMSEAYAYLMPQTDYVNLGFYHGASLKDPEGLLEGTGKGLRHVKVYDLEQAGQLVVRQLILESIDNRKKAFNL
jgi:Domain of unknown function (DU1801)